MTHDTDKPTSAEEQFEEWLCLQMPPNTVISDPKWWAKRILRAAKDALADKPQQTSAREALDVLLSAVPDTHDARASIWMEAACELLKQRYTSQPQTTFTDDHMTEQSLTATAITAPSQGEAGVPEVWQCKRGLAVEYVYDAESADRAANPTGIGPYGKPWTVTPLYKRPAEKGEAGVRDYSTPEARDYKALYFDLLLSVGSKHQNESRHDTAKRYILQAERGSDTPAQSARPAEKVKP